MLSILALQANDADLEKVTEVHQQEIQALEEAHQEELQQAEEEHQSLMQQLLQEGAQLQQDLEQEQQSIRVCPACALLDIACLEKRAAVYTWYGFGSLSSCKGRQPWAKG